MRWGGADIGSPVVLFDHSAPPCPRVHVAALLQVMAKMGISTLASYKGAQIYEALGIADEVGGWAQGTRHGGACWRQLCARPERSMCDCCRPRPTLPPGRVAVLQGDGVAHRRRGL